MNKSLLLVMFGCAAMGVASHAANTAGQLDRTFAKGGLFLAQNAGISNTTAFAVAIDSQGRILVAGQAPIPPLGSEQPAVFRLNPNGTLDTSFGSSGVASINFRAGGGQHATCLVVQPDGKIVIGVGFSGSDGVDQIALVRFDENGALDNSFGNSGTDFLFRGGPDTLFLVQQPDGKLLTGGGLLMVRTSADGILDSSFGQDGIAPLVAPTIAIVLQPDGKILAISGGVPGIGQLPVAGTILRYNENGTLDTSYGTQGRSGSIVDISAALLETNGDIVAVGPIISEGFVAAFPQTTFNTEFAVARYNSNGGVDDTFGSAGAVLTNFGTAPFALPASVIMQPNGNIIAGGEVQTSAPLGAAPSSGFELLRYTGTGALDSTFGSGGKVFTAIGPSSGSTNEAGIAGLALDAEGRLVAVGNVTERNSSGNGNVSIVVARYLLQ